MFWWPHGGHGERARARAGYGARRWAHGRPGRASAERFAALQRHQEALSLRSLFGGCSDTRTVETRAPRVSRPMSFPRSSTGRMPPEGTPSSICSRALPPPPPSMRASAPVPPPMAIAGMKRNGAMQLTAEQQHEPLARLDAVIANATASVAEACDRQVGQVRTALSHACETEVRQLRAVLAEACAGETEKLRAVLTSTCEEELRRVTASLSRSVEAVSASCQSEVERVKLALRAACELEVSAVVQRVKCDLAEACQVEVAALVSSMQHDVAVVRTEQRKQLEVAAEPYVRAVQSVHARTAQALEALQSRAGDESRRVRALEATMVTTSRRLLQMTLEVHARERALGVDARLRQGAPFLLLQVRRPEGFGSALLTQPAQLHVHPYMLRLAPDGDALVLLELCHRPYSYFLLAELQDPMNLV